MTLTEQWKKGELPQGVYYVIYHKNDTPEVDIYRQICSLYNPSEVKFTIPQVKEVLAEVPTYDDYMAMKDCVKAEFEAVTKMTQAKIDCEALAKLVLKLSPERKEWLEKHYGEYL